MIQLGLKTPPFGDPLHPDLPILQAIFKSVMHREEDLWGVTSKAACREIDEKDIYFPLGHFGQITANRRKSLRDGILVENPHTPPAPACTLIAVLHCRTPFYNA